MKEIRIAYRLAILALAGGLLLFTACPTGSDDDDDEPSPGPTTTTTTREINNVTYSSISGGTWTVQSDGSRKSPVIDNGGMTKARVSFTSTGTNTSITIQLRVSALYNHYSSYYAYAFISTLGNASATYSDGYYSGSRISDEQSVSITIPVPSPGDHFIDIGYQKGQGNSGGSDCAWFTVTDYTGTSSNPPNPIYTVSYTAGAGTGTPPATQTVETGTAITLPEQGAMIAPAYHTFEGWKTGGQTYAAKASFTVTADTQFVAQWKSIIDPAKTYIKFNNMEQFPAIMYSDPSRQTEIARAPASGTGTAIETESKPLGTSFYPSFLLEIEGVPITYDGPAITVRVDEKKVNTISIPALTSMETDFAYIKIENKSAYSLTLNKGNSELAPLGAAPSIIMPNETASYQVEPGDVGLYSFMRNTSSPISFPESVKQFNYGVIYDFTYTGTSLTLSSGNSALQSIPPKAPAVLTAAATAWNTIQLTWEPVYGATSYKLYRATGSGSLAELREAQGTSHIDTGLRSNTAYEYQVRAMSNKSGEGPASTSVSATTEELLAPASLTATAISWNSIQLSWEPVSGVSSYKLYRAMGSGSLEALTTAQGTSYTDTGLMSNTTYAYQVRALGNESDEGSGSTKVSATTEALKPAGFFSGTSAPGGAVASRSSL